MSCDGWGVGQRCKCAAAFKAIETRVKLPNRATLIRVGDQGVVTEKRITLKPHKHMLYVRWDRLGRNLPVLDKQIAYLAHV